MLEWLTKILGTVEGADALSDQIEKAIGKDFVSRKDFNEKLGELKETKSKIEGLEKTIADSGDAVKKLADLQAKYDTDIKTANAAAEKIKYDYAVDGEIAKAGANSVKAFKAMLDMEKVKVTDGKVEGLEDQVKELKKNSPWLFANQNQSPRRQGYQPQPAGDGGEGGGTANLGERIAKERIPTAPTSQLNALWGIGTQNKE